MKWTNHIYQFVILILLQVIVLNHIQLSGFINPYIYILFILMLPFEINNLLLLVLAFATGLTIDIFTGTLGLHTSATVFMAFCRPYVLKFIAPRDGYDMSLQPIARDMGWKWFSLYSGILILLHHLFFFYVEVFKMSQFFITLGRCLASFVFSFSLILLYQLFIYKQRQTAS